MSKAFASQADLEEKQVTFSQLSENAYAYTAEGDPNTAIVIQLKVFCEEQGISESLCLEGNDDASHVLALERSRPVATARVICRPDSDGELARVAVLPSNRKAGIGRALVLAPEEIAVQKDVRSITLKPLLSR